MLLTELISHRLQSLWRFPYFFSLAQFPLFTKVLIEGNSMVAILGSVYTRDLSISSSILNSFRAPAYFRAREEKFY